MRAGLWAMCLCIAACGRIGFDPSGDDARSDDGSMLDGSCAGPQLACSDGATIVVSGNYQLAITQL